MAAAEEPDASRGAARPLPSPAGAGEHLSTQQHCPGREHGQDQQFPLLRASGLDVKPRGVPRPSLPPWVSHRHRVSAIRRPPSAVFTLFLYSYLRQD